MLQSISKENLKLGRETPDEEGRNLLDVYLTATPRQLLQHSNGRKTEQAGTYHDIQPRPLVIHMPTPPFPIHHLSKIHLKNSHESRLWSYCSNA